MEWRGVIMENNKKPEFAVVGINYITLKKITYRDIVIPKGFVFDGVTLPAPFTMLFSNKDLRQGIKASCFHDFMCRHKDKYGRKEATDILIELWREAGLDELKAQIAKVSINIYQFLKGWK